MPPMGFDDQPTIAFYTQDENACRLPSSSTCALILWLPRNVTEPAEITELIVKAIKMSAGFGHV